MKKVTFISAMTAAVIGTAVLAGAASAQDGARHSMKGKHGNMYAFSAASERTAMMRAVDQISRANPATARMLKTLGPRVTFTTETEGVARVAPIAGPNRRATPGPRLRGDRYYVGFSSAVRSRETTRPYAQHMFDLLLTSSAGKMYAQYEKAAQAKLKRGKKAPAANDGILQGMLSDYERAVKLRTTTPGYLTAREMNGVLNTWREGQLRRF